MTVWKDDVAPSYPSSAHAVQFYENEGFLSSAVASFLAEGIGAGEPVVVIARAEHCRAFADQLNALGVDTSAIVFADAGEVLKQYRFNGRIDEQRFMDVVGALLHKISMKWPGKRIRAYGEMVDMLWQEGDVDGAIHVEELWNDLGRMFDFTLLCAYAVGKFYKTSNTDAFERICRTHDHVIPAESVSEILNDDTRARKISLLQHRAAALEAEIEYRKQLEKELRDALNARRAAETTLRQREREIIDFVENATVGLHWVGPDGLILWANNAELKLLGYTYDEYIGRHISEFHADRTTIEDILRRLSAGEEIRDCEARLIAKDGSIRHVVIDSNVLFNDGKFVHTRCFTRDVTDRRRLESANAFLLEATNTLYRSLDLETRLSELRDLVVPRLADTCRIDLSRDDQKMDISSLPSVTESEIVVPMCLSDHCVGTITMSVARRKFSSADLSLALELGRRAAIAIENALLYQRAQEANRAKDEFLATLSHELRTPLTAILGWARLVMIGNLDTETMRTAVETIERSARAQAALVDDLLDLSRVVTGKLSLETDLVDLRNVVEGAVQTQQLAANAKSIRLEVALAAGRMVVAGDATRLQQVVWNLVNNAIKFSTSGATVTVALERNAGMARIAVRDNGRGISAEFLPHVFEPFRQADAASTRSHGGLGLGLAIVKYLVELHGGSVSAISEGEGKGATFTVALPLAARASAAAARSKAQDAVDLRGTSVLFVDDDADTRELVLAILGRCGADVHAVGSVDSACQMIAARRPDVLITDIAMPARDGFALLDHVRSQEATRDIPVVALTAFAHASLEHRDEGAGFHAYVQKPVDPVQFARVIKSLRPVTTDTGTA